MSQGERVGYLDGLRAVAALMVFMIHSGAPALRGAGTLGNHFVDLGKYGVTVFFVVSAFSLCMTLTRESERGQISWSAYFVRRFFRIAPLYYAGLLVFSIFWRTDGLSLLLHMMFANVVAPQYANDLLSVEWSIAVEWGFYLLLPVLFAAARRPLPLVALVGVSLGLWMTIDRIAGGAFFINRGYSLVYHLYAFTAGIAAFWLSRNVKPPPVALHSLEIAAIALVCAVIWRGDSEEWIGLAVAIVTAATIFCCTSGSIAATVLSWTPLTAIGTISYSIYLTHTFALGCIRSIWIALAATIILSATTYWTIEQPGRTLGRWIAKGAQH